MVPFTIQNTFHEVLSAPALAPYRRFMIYTPVENPMQEQMNQYPIEGIRQIGWSPEGVVGGLNFLIEKAEAGQVSQYFLAPDAADQRKNINLIRIVPDQVDPQKPYIVLCAGGAYMSVCTMVEALPTARHFVAAGYQVFLMTYRTMEPAAAVKALEDLNDAFTFIRTHAEEFSIADPSLYALGGYSAGANLISNWGDPGIGYRSFGYPKPLCLFPIYTFINIKLEEKRDENGGLIRPMLGENYTPEDLDRFNVIDHLGEGYPPCYIVCGKDDNTVPPENSEEMAARLQKAGIPAILEEGAHAPHGFGDGTGTDVEGWPLRAIDFMNSLL